ncbi:hypothetical protein [Rhodobacter lacus]|uniref:DUF2125 domain-containing protein n=1 Tax=Rhodobacter lacus TaxID=1641972 RepID=A0ABW5A8S4_9RHOB
MYGKVLLTGTALAGVLAWGFWWAHHPHASGPGAVALQGKLTQAFGLQSPAVVVTPAFNHYIVTIAPDRVAGAPPPERAILATMTPWQVDLTPMEGGQWQVTAAPQDLRGRIALTTASASIDYTLKGYAVSALYDETLGFLRSWQTAFDSLEMVQSATMPASDPRSPAAPTTISRYRADGRALARGAGLDVTIRSGTEATTQEMAFPQEEGVVMVAATTGPSQSETRIEGLRWAEILPLLSLPKGGAQMDARQLAQNAAAAMPFFEKVTTSTEITAPMLALPQGPARAARAGAALSLAGTGAAAQMHYLLDVEGLSLPEEISPAWAKPLLPQDIYLDLGLEGYDPMGFFKAALSDYGAGKTPGEDALAQLVPGGRLSVSVAPSRITGPEYLFGLQGAFRQSLSAGSLPEQVQGKATMTGMDKVLAAFGTAPNPEQLTPALVLLGAMKALARPDGNGGLIWEIEPGPDGLPKVNGTMIGDVLN